MRPSLVSLALLVAGCSTGRYDADYAKALSAYRDAAARTLAVEPAPAAPVAGEPAAEPPPGEAAPPAAP
jgi:hypothetical protein